MLRRFVIVLVVSLIGCSSSRTIYKAPNRIDSVKLVKASSSEKEGGLRHPHRFERDKLREILNSISFSHRGLFKKEGEDRRLFEDRHIEFLIPYLLEGFEKVTSDEVVVVAFFTQARRWGLVDDRLTLFRAFVKEDGLHLKFIKLYAKLLGDRTTKGAERAIQEARGLRVSLEVQPGQNRISWDPEELVMDLKFDWKKGAVKRAQEPRSSESEAKALRPMEKRSVEERMKELERLKKEELITEKEYEKKRRKLLQEL
jgi:hypothetical protein